MPDNIEIKIDAVTTQQLLDVLATMQTLFITLMLEAGLDRDKVVQTLQTFAQDRPKGIEKAVLSGLATGIAKGSNPPTFTLTVITGGKETDPQ